MKNITIEELFKKMELDGYEQIVFHHDKKTGLKAITAIHNTELGFGLGGTRYWNYDNESEAVVDALRLAKGMTYKNAGAGIFAGGSKNVIIGKSENKSPELMHSYGRFIETLNGRVQTGQDVGISPSDVAEMMKETKYIAGKPSVGKSTAYFTAIGVFEGIKSAMKIVFNTDSFKGKTVAIQGVGAVGFDLAKYINQEGGNIVFADVNQDNINRIKNEIPSAKQVDENEILFIDCDILSPNALGNIFNDKTIPKLKTKIIAGAANNVLAEKKHGKMLADKGIIYAPDYIINAAGVIRAYWDTQPNFSEDIVLKATMEIGQRITKIIEISKKENISTIEAADKFAENFIDKNGKKEIWINK